VKESVGTIVEQKPEQNFKSWRLYSTDPASAFAAGSSPSPRLFVC
jgi:hypothetical protein